MGINLRSKWRIKLDSSPHKRIKEIEEMTENVSAGKIYVTAFLDFKTFKKFSETLAWETEVWIADLPDNMIHLNGDKFLGPRK